MKKIPEHKTIILNIILKWLTLEAKLNQWLEFKWGRKRFKIKRVI